jgi:uncharacterized delta-60 repeat protein
VLRRIALALGVLAIVASQQTVAAASGDLDPSFGQGGAVTLSTSPKLTVLDFALQHNGRIVFAGTTPKAHDHTPKYAVGRLRPDGRLDPSFGSGGITLIPLLDPDGTPCAAHIARSARHEQTAWAISLTKDGGILVAGRGCGKEIVIAKLDHDGSIDPTFGVDGVVRTPVRGLEAITDMTVTQDGEIVVAGSNSGEDAVVAEYRPEGVLDDRFAHDGVRAVDLSNDFTFVWSVAVQPDHKVVIAGNGYPSSGEPPFGAFVARLRYPGGRLDPSFGSGGIVFSPSAETFQAVTLEADGSIVAAGSGYRRNPGLAVARFTPAGAPDPAFGTDGARVVQGPNCCDASGFAVTEGPSGEIIAAGYGSSSKGDGIEVVVLGPHGWPDTSFGQGGHLFIARGVRPFVGAVYVDASGRIVVGGGGPPPYITDTIFARVLRS